MLQRCLIVALVAMLAAGSVFAQKKARKLPEGAYIKTAKIEILSGDLERYKTAMAMLDSLFINYGPHAEGMYWRCLMLVDMLDKASTVAKKQEYARWLVASIDSVKWICANNDIKRDYRKGCDNFIKGLDSTRESIWREAYNAGVAQVSEIENISKEIAQSTDSATIAFHQQRLPLLTDSCIQNMTLAILIDSADPRSYVGLGSIYERQKKYDSSNIWLLAGLAHAKDKAPLLSQVAYNFIQANKYCDAIPYFKEMVAMNPQDTSTMFNLSICYNNCKQYDSALAIQRQILQVAPSNTDALTGIGRYFNTQARGANDSVNAADDRKDEAAKKKWSAARDEAFDSSKTYFKRVFDLKPDDQFAAEEYALVCALRSDYKAAADAFKRATELDPSSADNWTSLGDCYLNLKQFKDAITAYEHVVEIQPDNKEIWQRLADLYQQEKMPDKQAEAEKKLKG